MQTQEEMEASLSYGVVAFIDVLGFGKQVENAETAEEIGECIAHIRRIRQAFDFDSADETIRSVDAIYSKRALAFSDSLLIYLPLQSDATLHEGTLDPLLMQLSNFASAQGLCVANGTFIRGGIDLDWWYYEEEILVSRGLVKSYSLENKADVPVLALTDDMMKHLREHPHRAYYADDIEPVSEMFRLYEGTAKDGSKNEFYYLDYLSSCLYDVMDNMTAEDRNEELAVKSDPVKRNQVGIARRLRYLREFAIAHATAIRVAHAAAPDKVKSKYVWLRDYHNMVMKEFGELASDTECVLK